MANCTPSLPCALRARRWASCDVSVTNTGSKRTFVWHICAILRTWAAHLRGSSRCSSLTCWSEPDSLERLTSYEVAVEEDEKTADEALNHNIPCSHHDPQGSSDAEETHVLTAPKAHVQWNRLLVGETVHAWSLGAVWSDKIERQHRGGSRWQGQQGQEGRRDKLSSGKAKSGKTAGAQWLLW